MDFPRTDSPKGLEGVFEELAATRSATISGLSVADAREFATLGVRIAGGRARLDDDVDLLSEQTVRDALRPEVLSWLRELDVRAHIDSTNTTLLDRASHESIDGCVLVAEVQTGGRGRRGRHWLSPFGRNLAVTIGAGSTRPAADLGALSLVVGIAVRTALIDFGVSDIELKWPNDVLLDGRKLAGILIELVRGRAPVEVVIGIGVNVGCEGIVAPRIDRSIADVAECVPRPSRNGLLALVINHVAAALRRFEAAGFEPFRDEWEQAHRYQGMPVVITSAVEDASEAVSGTVLGVGEDGSLRVQTADGIRDFNSGELAFREARQ